MLRAVLTFLVGPVHPGHCRPIAPDVEAALSNNRQAMQRSISIARVAAGQNRKTMAPLNEMLSEMRERREHDH